VAQPTGGDIHVNRPLSNISVAYQQNSQDFIADRVFPNVPVEQKSNVYYKYTKGAWFKTNAQKRAPATESAGTGWDVETDNYNAEVRAVHKDIADQDRANQDSPIIDLDRDATVFITRDILLRRELDWVTKYFATGIWHGANPDQTGVAAAPAANQFLQWNQSASTPIEDITAQRLRIAETTGYNPNTLVLGPRVWEKLKNHPEFLDRIKYTQKGIVTTDLLAATLDIERVLIPMVVNNTAADGATDSFGFGYGKAALLCYAAPSPGVLQPSAGYTFSWTGYLGASAGGSRIKRFRMEELASDRVEAELAYDQKVVSQDLGVFFTAAVA
jgi:hypothetical protein